MKRLLVLVFLVGCTADYSKGDKVNAYIQKDPSDNCRIFVFSSSDSTVRPMIARIENCKE